MGLQVEEPKIFMGISGFAGKDKRANSEFNIFLLLCSRASSLIILECDRAFSVAP